MRAAAANLPSFLRFGLRGLLLLWPRAACGRDDTVHPQVLDHLTVVILRMKGADNGDCETRREEWGYGLGQRRDLVFGGDPGNGPMAEREGILVFGHSFSSGNDFPLDNAIEHVED